MNFSKPCVWKYDFVCQRAQLANNTTTSQLTRTQNDRTKSVDTSHWHASIANLQFAHMRAWRNNNKLSRQNWKNTFRLFFLATSTPTGKDRIGLVTRGEAWLLASYWPACMTNGISWFGYVFSDIYDDDSLWYDISEIIPVWLPYESRFNDHVADECDLHILRDIVLTTPDQHIYSSESWYCFSTAWVDGLLVSCMGVLPNTKSKLLAKKHIDIFLSNDFWSFAIKRILNFCQIEDNVDQIFEQ